VPTIYNLIGEARELAQVHRVEAPAREQAARFGEDARAALLHVVGADADDLEHGESLAQR